MKKVIIRLSAVVFVLSFLSPLYAQVSGLSGWDIFLDPGHSQTQNMGIYGYSEAEKNLGVALELRAILLSETDIDTAYISRTNSQQLVSLSQRTDKANSVGAAWYHSMHSNAGSSTANTALLLWGQYQNNTEKNPHGGKALGDIMVDNLAAGMRIQSIGSWGDHTFYGGCPSYRDCPWLYVNYYTNMPSELSEAGYHTNAHQNQLNMNADWKRLEARTLYWSILQLHGIARPPVHIINGIVKDTDSNIPINGARIEVDGRVYTTDTYQSLFYKYSSDPSQLHNGFYYFENVAPETDSVQIIVSAENYYSDTAMVKIDPSFLTFQDFRLISKIPPTVVTTTPLANDSAFSVLNNVSIRFSRPMDKASVDSLLVQVPAFPFTASWSNSDKLLTLKSDSLKILTTYQISIGGEAQDRFGHTLDGNGDGVGGDGFTFSFTTDNDREAPLLIDNFPKENQLNVELLPIVSLHFDEALDSSTVNDNFFQLERFSDHSLVPLIIKGYKLGDKYVVNLFPQSPLATDNIYLVHIVYGIKDLLGNATGFNRLITFRTGVDVANVTMVDNFENGIANWWEPGQSGSTTGTTENIKLQLSDSITNILSHSAQAMALSYGWDPAADSWLMREYLSGGTPRGVQFGSGSFLQVYVFGDGSGNLFRFAVDDHLPAGNASYHEVSPWYSIDWLGWKLVSWDMTNDGTGVWLGDGVLDGTLRFDSIQLSHQSGAALNGTLYFDDLRVVQKTVSALRDEAHAYPREFTLYPNYPNPFNPGTHLRFALPQAENVLIDVYSVLGKKVKSLRGYKPAGWQEMKFDGTGLPSGIYLYTIRAGAYRRSGKMILAK